jgi:hypothetical protein
LLSHLPGAFSTPDSQPGGEKAINNQKLSALLTILIVLIASAAVHPPMSYCLHAMYHLDDKVVALNPCALLAGGAAVAVATGGLGLLPVAFGLLLYAA